MALGWHQYSTGMEWNTAFGKWGGISGMERNGMEWSAAEKDTWNEWNDFIPFHSIPLIPPVEGMRAPAPYSFLYKK